MVIPWKQRARRRKCLCESTTSMYLWLMAPFSLLPSCWCFCCALSPWSFTLYTSPLPIFKSHQSCPFLELNSNVIISNWLTMVYKNSADIKNTANCSWGQRVKNVLQLYLIYGALLKKCWKSIMSFVSKKKWPFFHLLKKVSEGSRRVIFFFLLLINQNTFCGLDLLCYSLLCVRPENLSNFQLFSQVSLSS